MDHSEQVFCTTKYCSIKYGMGTLKLSRADRQYMAVEREPHTPACLVSTRLQQPCRACGGDAQPSHWPGLPKVLGSYCPACCPQCNAYSARQVASQARSTAARSRHGHGPALATPSAPRAVAGLPQRTQVALALEEVRWVDGARGRIAAASEHVAVNGSANASNSD